MSDLIWLNIDHATQIAIDRKQAMAMTEKDLAKLYRRTVYGRSRREARDWARRQVAERAAALLGETPE